jgi:hypothetical protein
MTRAAMAAKAGGLTIGTKGGTLVQRRCYSASTIFGTRIRYRITRPVRR